MTVESDGNDKAKKKLGWSFWLKRTDGYHEKPELEKTLFLFDSEVDTYQRGKKYLQFYTLICIHLNPFRPLVL